MGRAYAAYPDAALGAIQPSSGLAEAELLLQLLDRFVGCPDPITGTLREMRLDARRMDRAVGVLR